MIAHVVVALVACAVLTACSAKHGRPDHTNDGGADATIAAPDATDDAALVDAMLSDAGIDASDGAVLTECDRQFNALNDSCQVNEDCAVVWQHACVGNGATGRALGVSRSAQAMAQQVSDSCRLTFDSPNCDANPYEITLAPHRTDDGRISLLGDWEIGVRCERNRCNTYVSSCGPDLCGNGVVDECLATYSDFGTSFAPRPDGGVVPHPSVGAFKTEDCDGFQLNQHTCQSLGYGDGVVACQPLACHFDDSRCKACVPPAGMVTTCAEDVVGSALYQPHQAMAVSDTTTLIATTRRTGDVPVIDLTRFDADLIEVGSITLSGDALGVAPIAGEIALAPRPGGWLLGLLVEAEAASALHLHALHANGSYDHALPHVEGIYTARVVTRDATPQWLVSSGASAAGTFEVRRFEETLALSQPTVISGLAVVDAVSVGDALFVAFNGGDGVLKVQRVEADGTVIEPAHPHDGAVVRSVLAIHDTGPILMTWGPQTTLVRLGPDGARLGEPIVVGAVIEGYDVEVSGWSDGLIVAHRSVSTRAIAVMRVGLDGAVSLASDVMRHTDVMVPIGLHRQADHLVLGASRLPEATIGGWLQLVRLRP